jgi:hypothetical protein
MGWPGSTQKNLFLSKIARPFSLSLSSSFSCPTTAPAAPASSAVSHPSRWVLRLSSLLFSKNLSSQNSKASKPIISLAATVADTYRRRRGVSSYLLWSSIQFNNNKECDSLCLTWRLLANTEAVPLVDLCKEQIKGHVRALKKAIEVSLLIPVLPSPSIKSYTHMKGSHTDTYEPITKKCHLHFLVDEVNSHFHDCIQKL